MSTDEFRLKFKIESNGHEFEEAKKKDGLSRHMFPVWDYRQFVKEFTTLQQFKVKSSRYLRKVIRTDLRKVL